MQRVRRALYVTRVARHAGIRRVLAEIGVAGNREATREGAQKFRQALEELGTTFIKLGQLLSSRPDLLPDVYIEELAKLVDQVPPVSFDEIRRLIAEELPDDPFVRLDGRKVDEQHGLPSDRAEELARQLFKGYVHQVTVEGVYHADPHRGNVLLLEDGRLALVDFGLLGRLDDDTRRTMSLLLLAVAQNRADDVADLILGLSRTTLMSDEPGFLHDLRRKLPRYHGRPLSGIRAGEALADLQRISFEYGISLPTSFALVGKTL